jgi:hypothetical protein
MRELWPRVPERQAESAGRACIRSKLRPHGTQERRVGSPHATHDPSRASRHASARCTRRERGAARPPAYQRDHGQPPAHRPRPAAPARTRRPRRRTRGRRRHARRTPRPCGCGHSWLHVHGNRSGPAPHGWQDGGRLSWRRGDWLATTRDLAPTVVLANLFFHHFEAVALREWGLAAARSARVIICREPARHRAWMRHALAPLGLHPITWHDMAASIRAGFLGDELPSALGLSRRWLVKTRHTLRGAYEMIATQPSPSP